VKFLRPRKSISRRQAVLLGHNQHKKLDAIESGVVAFLQQPMHDFTKLVISNILDDAENRLIAQDSILDIEKLSIIGGWLNTHKSLKLHVLRFIYENVFNASKKFIEDCIDMHAKSRNKNSKDFFDIKNIRKDFDNFRKQNEQYFDECFTNHAENLQEFFLENWQKGARHEDIAKQLIARGYDKGILSARKYARKQVSTLNSLLNQQQQTSLGVATYTWVTTIDGREREEHHERHLQVFHWSNPPKNGPPGIPWGCRCSAIPIF